MLSAMAPTRFASNLTAHGRAQALRRGRSRYRQQASIVG
jgi:hypothetical protein